MHTWKPLVRLLIASLFAVTVGGAAFAADTGTLAGTVRLKDPGTPLAHATVTIIGLGKAVESGDDGAYLIGGIPPGLYQVTAHLHQFTDTQKSIQVEAGRQVNLDFDLSLQIMKQELTVTASLQEESVLDTFSAVISKESFDLLTKASSSAVGDLLSGEPGISERSGGPGTGRPVIRGFDGDRVLVMQDGIRTGTLSSSSADHGEPLDVSSVERVEVVRGPATLLYGSNAIGGVVNVISNHHFLHHHAHDGVLGEINGGAGSANGQANGGGNVEIGKGNWMLWLGGGGLRTGDYSTPVGKVQNSSTDFEHTSGGIGYYGEKAGFDAGYAYSTGLNGVPFAGADGGLAGGETEPVSVAFRKHNLRGNIFFHDVNTVIDDVHIALNYSDWNHTEMEGSQVGTDFFNKQFVYRSEFTQRKYGRLDGKFGIWGMHRNFEAIGAEALSPPVDQNGFAGFALEEVSFEKFRLQFGARIDHNSYNVMSSGLPDRSFNGLSGSAGINVPLWKDGSFVASYSRSQRSPALEELYNNGPHAGNATYEVGNPNLRAEIGNGLDLVLRHNADRFIGELTFFYNRMNNFVYLQPNGEIRQGLPVGLYTQDDSRFIGTEARAQFRVHPSLWLKLGTDYVNAEIRRTQQALPRIPPMHGKVGLDWRYKSLSVEPEVELASDQAQLAPNETRTPGYTVFNLNASYTITQAHLLHQFSVTAFNLGDRLYRNHLSLIKEIAPEMGRGIRINYTVRFF
jgi:iron complex outermembrane recepter protein